MKHLIFRIREILYPSKCMLCRTILQNSETDLCHSCRKETPEYPFGAQNPAPKGKINLQFLDSFTAVWYYDGNVRKSIHRYKFNKAMYLAPKYGRILAMKLLKQGPEHVDIVTWVPVSRLRKIRRGFDQCQLLAESVGGELGLPVNRLLVKIHHRPPQSGIHLPEERKANVLGAYASVKGTDLKGKSILLLDDVYTTGATMDECARVLLSAGAAEVHCAAIAVARSRKKDQKGE